MENLRQYFSNQGLPEVKEADVSNMDNNIYMVDWDNFGQVAAVIRKKSNFAKISKKVKTGVTGISCE